MTPAISLPEIILSEIARGNQELIEQYWPRLEPNFFRGVERVVLQTFSNHLERYKAPATFEEAQLGLQEQQLEHSVYEQATEYLTNLYQQQPPRHPQWLKDQVAEFVRKQAYRVSLEKADNAAERGEDPGPYLEAAREAWHRQFDCVRGVGLTVESIYESIQAASTEKWSVQSLIRWPKVAPGEIAVIQAAPNCGKSLALVHITGDCLKQGRNVLFISMEMGEGPIQRRITANLLQHDINALHTLSKEEIRSGLDKLGSLGKLKIRQYESGNAHAGHFEQYIRQLASEEQFVPDVIVVDYLNECASKTLSHSKSMTSYQYVGACMGELRALAVKLKVVVWTATQTNRAGYDNQPDMKNTSDSAQINQKADVMVGLCPKKEHPELLLTHVIKMRDGEKPKPFLTRVDFCRMSLYDNDDPALDQQESEVLSKSFTVETKTPRRPTAPRFGRKS
jgi:archaellum biogenesis ATPase FlaH